MISSSRAALGALLAVVLVAAFSPALPGVKARTLQQFGGGGFKVPTSLNEAKDGVSNAGKNLNEAANKAAENAQREAQRARDNAREEAERAADRVKEAKERAQERAQEIADNAKEEADRAKEQAQAIADKAREEAQELADKVEEEADQAKEIAEKAREEAQDVYDQGKELQKKGEKAWQDSKDFREDFEEAGKQSWENIEDFSSDPTKPLRELTKRSGFTKCDTDEKKREFRGDWDFATFGPAEWDYGTVVNVAMVVFPPTSAAGMKEVYRKIENQGEAMLEGLMKAARHAGGNAEKKVKNLILGMVNQLMEGRVPEVNRPFDTLDLKMAIIRVNCWNEFPEELGGEKIANSEGKVFWAMGYRLR